MNIFGFTAIIQGFSIFDILPTPWGKCCHNIVRDELIFTVDLNTN